MPSKLENIVSLYSETLSDISKSSENWASFLLSASVNYKYGFQDQVLIFVQRPDATACADIQTWNKQIKRWVNKGAKGIALLNEVNGRNILKHVFDVSDTHNYYGTKLNLWKVEDKYNDEIVDSLEARFGTLENKSDLAQAIISASYNSVQDNLPDYLNDLITSKKDSLLEDFDDFGIEVKFRRLLSNSVAFMTMNRCGINPFDYFEMEDFIDICDFNTIDTISRIGAATSDIAETNLREIHNTIKNLKINEKKINRTFVKNENIKDNIEKESERSGDYGNNIQTSRRLSDSEFNVGGNKRESISRQILSNEVTLFEGTQKRTIHGFNDEKQVKRTFTRSARNSNQKIESNNSRDDEERTDNRGIENQGPNDLGTNDEQHQKLSGRNNLSRDNLQLNLFSEDVQKKIIADMSIKDVPANFIFTQEMIDLTLQEGSHFAEGKFRIYRQMTTSLSSKENAEFLKHEYGIGGATSAYKGSEIGIDYDAKGIKLHLGYGENRPEKLLSWNEVEKRIKQLIMLDRYLNQKEFDEYLIWLEKDTQEKIHIAEVTQDKSLEEKLLKLETDYDVFDREETTIEDVKNDLEDKNSLIDYLEQVKDAENNNEELQKDFDKIINEIKETQIIEPELKPVTKENIAFQAVNDVNAIRINFKITDDNVGVGSPKERFKNNVEAIKILKKCESENRLATKEEQSILSKYVGWGGLANAFNNEDNNWSNEYSILSDLLTEEEYKNARASTLTAFYTPPIVIKLMYKVLENMGVKTANILEPSCGTGNFLGNVPDTINSKIYGIELDSISGRIARQLYQKENIVIDGFEKVDLPDSFFDVAIGNVPFGDFKVNDKRYDKNNFLIHDYFFR